ncbi:hypothetical protein BDZ45DRAFT_749045 [Acephala macrosclerotiorum]|nr:hypothetical protein BDZ45DRAFT_749045 [Acephala macrosclerotiorum]
MDLQSFSLFNQLPCEIRMTIWFYAMIPATVYATPVPNENPRNLRNPCLLRVCRESRTACLQRYRLAPDIDDNGKTYINFDLDTVYLECWPQIQYFALDLEWLSKFGLGRLLFRLDRCLKLRKVSFVVKSTTVDEEHEVDITNTIAKYEDMKRTDRQLYVEQFGTTDLYNLDFSRQSEAIAILWAGSLYRSSLKVRCPEISVISRPIKIQEVTLDFSFEPSALDLAVSSPSHSFWHALCSAQQYVSLKPCQIQIMMVDTLCGVRVGCGGLGK